MDSDTLFPAASISKWLTAMSVMTLAERGLVELDRPVADYLTRWRLPESGFDHDQVTVRRLLSHTAGLTDGLGFGDDTRDEVVPGVAQSLMAPRAWSGVDVRRRVDELADLAGLDDIPDTEPSTPLLPTLPLELRAGPLRLALFTVISTFGTPQDITTDELRIEAFFPADAETDQLLHAMTNADCGRTKTLR